MGIPVASPSLGKEPPRTPGFTGMPARAWAEGSTGRPCPPVPGLRKGSPDCPDGRSRGSFCEEHGEVREPSAELGSGRSAETCRIGLSAGGEPGCGPQRGEGARGGRQPAGRRLPESAACGDGRPVWSVCAARRGCGCAAGSSPPHRRSDRPPRWGPLSHRSVRTSCLGRRRRVQAPGPHRLPGRQVSKQGARRSAGGWGQELGRPPRAPPAGRPCVQ